MADDWLMSALAAQDAYRGDEPAWPDAPQPMGAVANPWADFMSRDQPLPTHAPQQERDKYQQMAKGAVDTLATPGAMFAQNPYKEGTEEADWFDRNKFGMAYPWSRGMALNTMGTGALAGVPARAGEAVLGSGAVRPIRAYHSSPHDFEKFDASKIGTGQGAASYGVGHYLAENPKVSGQGGEYWNEFLRKFSGDEMEAAKFLREKGFNRGDAIAEANQSIAGFREKLKGVGSTSAEDLGLKFPTAEDQRVYRDNLAVYYNNLIKEQQAKLGLLETGKPVGPRTYEVDIHARPEQFLDWDRPLATKTPVREILADVGMKGTGSPYADVRNVSKDAFLAAQNPTLTGEGAYRSLARAAVRPEDIRPGFSAHSPYAASDTLREAGIPGIRYLDQGSRALPGGEILGAQQTPQGWISSIRGAHPSAFNGGTIFTKSMPFKTEAEALAWANEKIKAPTTSNYVVFPGNEHLLRIAKKYGLAGVVPTMGALAAMDKYGGEMRQ